MMSDDLDDFIEFDLAMGADVVKCPHCGADVPSADYIYVKQTHA